MKNLHDLTFEKCLEPTAWVRSLVVAKKKNNKIIYSMKEMLYEVRCLKSNEDMILALAGQFKRLSHEPENSGDSTGFEPMTSAMPVQCSNQLS